MVDSPACPSASPGCRVRWPRRGGIDTFGGGFAERIRVLTCGDGLPSARTVVAFKQQQRLHAGPCQALAQKVQRSELCRAACDMCLGRAGHATRVLPNSVCCGRGMGQLRVDT